MNFADRLSIECMMNKGLYAKYQSAQKQTQKTEFQLKKKQYHDEIQKIVQRLLDDNNDKKEKDDANDEEEDDASNKSIEEEEIQLVLHPKVINHFNDFVSACIENLDDFHDDFPNKTKKKQEQEECAPMFMEESDEEKYYGNSSNSEDEDEDKDKDAMNRRQTKNIKSVNLFSVFDTDHF